VFALSPRLPARSIASSLAASNTSTHFSDLACWARVRLRGRQSRPVGPARAAAEASRRPYNSGPPLRQTHHLLPTLTSALELAAASAGRPARVGDLRQLSPPEPGRTEPTRSGTALGRPASTSTTSRSRRSARGRVMRRKPGLETLPPRADRRRGAAPPTASPPRGQAPFRATDAAAQPRPLWEGREMGNQWMTRPARRPGCRYRRERRCAEQRSDEHHGEQGLAGEVHHASHVGIGGTSEYCCNRASCKRVRETFTFAKTSVGACELRPEPAVEVHLRHGPLTDLPRSKSRCSSATTD
jgi:hypothetical protein